MWHQSRRISPVFFDQPTLSWEYLPYHINFREEEALLSYNSGKCPYELRNLVFADQIYIKKIKTHFTILGNKKEYKITDNQGTVLFHVEKVKHSCLNPQQFCSNGRDNFPISYNVKSEPELNLVFTLRGFPGVFGGGAHLSTKLIKFGTRLHLGEVVQEPRFCDPVFSIIDSRGDSSFSIQGPEEGNCWGVAPKAEFNICQHDRTPDANGTLRNDVLIVGKLRRNQKIQFTPKNTSIRTNRLSSQSSLGKNDPKTEAKRKVMDNSEKCKWEIEFPRDLDPGTKVMVISAAFLLESQYY